MRILHLKDAALNAPQAIALGYFDGGHIGHAALIRKTVSEARRTGCESAVFSFLHLPTKKGAPLSSEADRLRFFEAAGIQNVILADFDEVRDLSPDAFCKQVLTSRLAARFALCGFNFRFGRGAAGDGALLCQALPGSIVLPPTLYKGAPVSSTRIREALSHGALDDASAMLGHPYTVSGTVSHGRAIGRSIGFPTANITTPLFLPRFGVYKTRATVDGASYTGLTNVGVRPTVEGAGEVRVETFLPDFSGDLYEKSLHIAFLAFLREERHFDSLDALQAQIAKDISLL